jgi:hypothetical protein
MKRIPRFWRRLLAGFVIAIALTLIPLQPTASIPPEPSIPTTAIALDDSYVRVPDWSRITFRTLPPILSDGSFISTPDINQQLGYDLSRFWQSGQSADSYLKLGDFQTSLYLQLFNLDTLAQITHMDLEQVALGTFQTITWQTLDDLVDAIPGLSEFQVA